MNKRSIAYLLVGIATGSFATALAVPMLSANEPNFGTQANPSPIAQTQPVPGFPRMGQGWRGMSGEQVEQHFITRMIPHHQDAIAMTELVLERSESPEIRELAQNIKNVQTREIEAMRTWYEGEYGTNVPEWQPGWGGGMRHCFRGRWGRGYGN